MGRPPVDKDLLVLLFIIVVRGGVPFLVFRWQFAGGLLCILADASDSILQDALGAEPLKGHYHLADKSFDTYYLLFEAIVAYRWLDPLARWAAIALFALRAGGVVFYELTEIRATFLMTAERVRELLSLRRRDAFDRRRVQDPLVAMAGGGDRLRRRAEGGAGVRDALPGGRDVALREGEHPAVAVGTGQDSFGVRPGRSPRRPRTARSTPPSRRMPSTRPEPRLAAISM